DELSPPCPARTPHHPWRVEHRAWTATQLVASRPHHDADAGVQAVVTDEPEPHDHRLEPGSPLGRSAEAVFGHGGVAARARGRPFQARHREYVSARAGSRCSQLLAVAIEHRESGPDRGMIAHVTPENNSVHDNVKRRL